MDECIAVMNAGSSSIKFALYDPAGDQELLFRGQIERISVSPHLSVTNAAGEQVLERSWAVEGLTHLTATHVIFDTVIGLIQGKRVRAVGHRFVHGGADFATPVLLTPVVLD